MAKRRVDTNPDLQKEQAEGEQDTVAEALERDDDIEHGGRDAGTSGAVPARERQGVTNQPLGEEEEQQRQLPPRGQAKKGTPGGHA